MKKDIARKIRQQTRRHERETLDNVLAFVSRMPFRYRLKMAWQLLRGKWRNLNAGYR